MDPRAEPYAVLGLPEGAPWREVQRAYRRLALRFHPDVGEEREDRARFLQVQAAYDTLRASGAHRPAPPPPPEDPAPPPPRRGARKESIWYGLGSDLREAAFDALEAVGLGYAAARATPVRVLGDGELLVACRLRPREAMAGVTVPFSFHLGPHLVEENLRVPPGTRPGTRHVYRLKIDDDLTLKVHLLVDVEP